jgi:hypothetical protein
MLENIAETSFLLSVLDKRRSCQCEVPLYISDYASMCAEQLFLMSKHRHQTSPRTAQVTMPFYRGVGAFLF